MSFVGYTGYVSADAGEHVFELSGGALCLDFANTLGDRPHGEKEHLRGYADLLAWGRQAGALPAAELSELEGRALDRPRAAARALGRAMALREAVYRTFSALAAGGEPAAADLAALNRALRLALSRLRVAVAGQGFTWAWAQGGERLDAVLWPVVRSAADLVTSAEAERVRECASDRCSWLFLDRSPTRRRKWCDMKTCGNRAKARRHYRRRKERRRRA